MELSIFLAKAWGFFLLVISFAFLVNRKNLQTIFKAYENDWNVLLSGIVNLVVGILMVLSHNIWSADWRVLITLFGWIALIKGAVRLVWPGEVNIISNKLKGSKWIPIFLVIALAFGLYLIFLGFTS